MTSHDIIWSLGVLVGAGGMAGAAEPTESADNGAPAALIAPTNGHELYISGKTLDEARPTTWPAQVVVQPNQRMTLRVPAFLDAASTDPRRVAVRPSAKHGLIYLAAAGAAAEITATKQPVDVTVKVDATTTRKIPVVLRSSVVADLQELLKGLEGIAVALEAGYVVVRGALIENADRRRLDRILALYPGVVDLTGDAIDAPDKMVEIDVVIVVVNDRIVRRIGFDFLQAVQLHFDIFQTWNYRSPAGNPWPVPLDTSVNSPAVLQHSQWGETLSAAVEYNVNIANAIDEGSKVIARPHLVTLSGQPAEFHAGGEIAFRLEGVQVAELERYERGIILNVTPTLLRPVKPGGKPRVLIDAEVTRISVTDLLLGGASGGDVDFDKTRVKSKTILEMDQTLILSGIYQREYRKQNDGVPGLRDVPGLKLFFSRESTLQDVVSTIVFLTPREPGYLDQANEEATRAFVERRRKYIEARESGDPELLAKFKAEHPDWMRPQPNRYATHFFLRDNSSVYLELRGEDLSEEEVQKNILNIPSAKRAYGEGD